MNQFIQQQKKHPASGEKLSTNCTDIQLRTKLRTTPHTHNTNTIHKHNHTPHTHTQTNAHEYTRKQTLTATAYIRVALQSKRTFVKKLQMQTQKKFNDILQARDCSKAIELFGEARIGAHIPRSDQRQPYSFLYRIHTMRAAILIPQGMETAINTKI